jgi:hypothetical protein
MTSEVPNTDPTTWLYDRLRRDYGILATSSLFGIHTAPLAELHRYQEVVQAWLEKKGSMATQNETGEEIGEDEIDGEETGEETGEDEEEEYDLDDILDDLDEYVDDSEMWR